VKGETVLAGEENATEVYEVEQDVIIAKSITFGSSSFRYICKRKVKIIEARDTLLLQAGRCSAASIIAHDFGTCRRVPLVMELSLVLRITLWLTWLSQPMLAAVSLMTWAIVCAVRQLSWAKVSAY
jgi:hypothetical protein